MMIDSEDLVRALVYARTLATQNTSYDVQLAIEGIRLTGTQYLPEHTRLVDLMLDYRQVSQATFPILEEGLDSLQRKLNGG